MTTSRWVRYHTMHHHKRHACSRCAGARAHTALVPAHSPAQALALVVSGRVDATTVLCQLNGVDAKEQYLSRIPVLLLYPPLYQSHGYLMLSQQFYQRHPQLSERLWQALPATLDKNRYLYYLTPLFY